MRWSFNELIKIIYRNLKKKKKKKKKIKKKKKKKKKLNKFEIM